MGAHFPFLRLVFISIKHLSLRRIARTTPARPTVTFPAAEHRHCPVTDTTLHRLATELCEQLRKVIT